jgi:uncharacterized protein DUF4136
MITRVIFGVVLCVAAACGEVKAKLYTNPPGCFKTYHLATGRVLTTRGLIEDPTVNTIMKDAVSMEMKGLKIAEAPKSSAELEVRFMGGNTAGLQADDLTTGDVAMWDVGGPQAIEGRTYKKSNLVIVVVDNKSNRTLWAARCTDKFGDPNHVRERIQKAISKAFAKFPKSLGCG